MQESSYTFSSKEVLKFFIKLLIFIILMMPMVVFIGKKYSSASTENIINRFSEKRVDDFYNLPENSLDMVFVGSSHSYCTFDPEIFDEILNISSFQMGMPLQHPDSTYYTIREILNYQNPRYIVMEVYWDLLQNDFELNQVKTLFQVLRNEELKDEYIQDAFPLEEKVKYSVNLLKYQEDYFAYKGNDIKNRIKAKFVLQDKVQEKQIGIEEYRSKGYVYCDYQMLASEYDKTNQFRELDGNDVEFSKEQLNYLKKIIELCEENNIELIFVTAPIANVSMDYIKNYNTINDKISAIALENNIFYIDYNILNMEESILTNDNFRDDAHLNDSGVKIISNHFINVLVDNNLVSK